MTDFERDGWQVNTWDGEFEPMAGGPKDVWLEVDADTITVQHEVPYSYGQGTSSERVTFPRDWLLAAIFAADAYRERTGKR